MNRIRRIRRLAGVAAALAGSLLAVAAAAPNGLARPSPPGPRGWQLRHPPQQWHWTGPASRVPGHTVVIGGMPGWQIALIVAATALTAATIAMLLWTGPGPRAGTGNPAAFPRLSGVPELRCQPAVRPARLGEAPIPDEVTREAA